MGKDGNGNGLAQWYLVLKPEQRGLYEILCARLEGSGVQVVLERRSRERRRGSFGPAMDRRQTDRGDPNQTTDRDGASATEPPPLQLFLHHGFLTVKKTATLPAGGGVRPRTTSASADASNASSPATNRNRSKAGAASSS